MSSSATPFGGQCEERFEALRSAFEASFEQGDGSRRELGGALAVAIDGELVVDLWGGWADPARTRPWQRDTIVNVYSCTKGVSAVCAHRLVDQGKLDLEAPVAHYWPEFAQGGKAQLSVRQLLSHQGGLAAIREKIPYENRFDWDCIAEALAAQEPWWEPGTKHGYHAVTFGNLVGELVRRIDGRSIGRYLREEIALPLDLDFHIGLPEQLDARCADIVHASADSDGNAGGRSLSAALRKQRQSLLGLAFANPAVPLGEVNSSEWRRAELPAHGGHGTARGLARLYSGLASGGTLDGTRLLSPEAIERATEEQAYGRDAVLAPLKTRFGMGFMLHSRGIPLGRSGRGFGHPGYGGAVAFADPEARLGFAFVANRLKPQLMGGLQSLSLVEAAYEGIGAAQAVGSRSDTPGRRRGRMRSPTRQSARRSP